MEDSPACWMFLHQVSVQRATACNIPLTQLLQWEIIRKRSLLLLLRDFVASVDDVPPNTPWSSCNALLYVFGDNEAVIRMSILGRSPLLRHVTRIHRSDFDYG